MLDFYDTYITPYNGNCAYRVLNNSFSCSEYFRNIVDKKGVIPACMAMPEQFHRCGQAYSILKMRKKDTCSLIGENDRRAAKECWDKGPSGYCASKIIPDPCSCLCKAITEEYDNATPAEAPAEETPAVEAPAEEVAPLDDAAPAEETPAVEAPAEDAVSKAPTKDARPCF